MFECHKCLLQTQWRERERVVEDFELIFNGANISLDLTTVARKKKALRSTTDIHLNIPIISFPLRFILTELSRKEKESDFCPTLSTPTFTMIIAVCTPASPLPWRRRSRGRPRPPPPRPPPLPPRLRRSPRHPQGLHLEEEAKSMDQRRR